MQKLRKTDDKREDAERLAGKVSVSASTKEVSTSDIPTIKLEWTDDITGNTVSEEIKPTIPTIRLADSTVVKTTELIKRAKGEAVGDKLLLEITPGTAMERLINLAKMKYNF